MVVERRAGPVGSRGLIAFACGPQRLAVWKIEPKDGLSCTAQADALRKAAKLFGGDRVSRAHYAQLKKELAGLVRKMSPSVLRALLVRLGFDVEDVGNGSCAARALQYIASYDGDAAADCFQAVLDSERSNKSGKTKFTAFLECLQVVVDEMCPSTAAHPRRKDAVASCQGEVPGSYTYELARKGGDSPDETWRRDTRTKKRGTLRQVG